MLSGKKPVSISEKNVWFIKMFRLLYTKERKKKERVSICILYKLLIVIVEDKMNALNERMIHYDIINRIQGSGTRTKVYVKIIPLQYTLI